VSYGDGAKLGRSLSGKQALLQAEVVVGPDAGQAAGGWGTLIVLPLCGK